MTYNKYTHFLMYEDGEEYDTTYKAGDPGAIFRHLLLRSLRRQHYLDWFAASAATRASPAHAGAKFNPMATRRKIALWVIHRWWEADDVQENTPVTNC
jgi:hypothetical protein